jgi:hypothetical protein
MVVVGVVVVGVVVGSAYERTQAIDMLMWLAGIHSTRKAHHEGKYSRTEPRPLASSSGTTAAWLSG